MSASFSTVSGMAYATAGIILDPYKEYRRHRTQSQSQDSTSLQTPPDTCTTNTNTEVHTKRVALVAASSIGKLLGRPSRGALVDLPLAAVEGMRAVPRIYGDELKAHGKVTDWKSGGAAAWSTFSHGLYEGVTDIFVHTYHGKKEQGAVGVAKGLTKGFVGFTAKTGAATVGLIAYPNQGIYRSLRTAVRTGPAKRIEQSRWAEVGYLMVQMGEGLSIDPEGVCEAFDTIMVSRSRKS